MSSWRIDGGDDEVLDSRPNALQTSTAYRTTGSFISLQWQMEFDESQM